MQTSDSSSSATKSIDQPSSDKKKTRNDSKPTLEPYFGRLERLELFSTNQAYYIVGSNKLNTAYRIIKIDRTLIEKPNTEVASTRPFPNDRPPAQSEGLSDSRGSGVNATDNSHTAKPTLRPLSEFLTEDPNIYTQEEIKDMLDMIHDGNRMTMADGTAGSRSHGGQRGGGLKPIVKAYGIVGFVRFLENYYLTLITKRSKVGNIGGHGIYTIKNTETVPLKPAEQGPLPGSEDLDPSSVLLSMWNRGKRSVGLGLTNREIAELRYQGLYQVVDLSKNFFFSYTYDMTRSLQENFLASTSQTYPPPPSKDLFAWNYFLTREFEDCLNRMSSYHWIIPIVHGAVVQRKVNDYGRALNLILIARRSRHFAGTRYLKRGVSEQGKVANDVEHEQILHDETNSSTSGAFASYLQVRGSIPTFWLQESSVTIPKPPIDIFRIDPTYSATRLHFEDLMTRYSSPILVLDLVKQSEKREREVRVGNEYRHAIQSINDTIQDPTYKIRYCALDYSHISKHRSLDVSAALSDCSVWAVNQTGFFCSAPKWKIVGKGIIRPFSDEDSAEASSLSGKLGVPMFPMEQMGVLRTNCIDCLDRTNVAQFSAGVEAIGQQLVVMGIRSSAKLDSASTIVRVLIDMYVDIGDVISMQYGGSEAHKKMTGDRADSNMAIGKHKELLTSIRRYYSNAFTDRLKQDAMNLFLGYYVPYRHDTPLWELETDYYLHNLNVKLGKGTNHTMKFYQQAYGIHSYDESTPTLPDSTETPSSERIRSICTAQSSSLSTWWKVAIENHIKQRMWISLGKAGSESLLPPLFDHLYQPEKMAHFDKFFARGWVTPARRAPGINGNDDCSNAEFRKDLSILNVYSDDQYETDYQEDLNDFVLSQGSYPQQTPKLEMLASYHDRRSFSTYTFMGYHKQSQKCEYRENDRFVTPSENLFSGPHDFDSKKIDDFNSWLHDYSLSSNNVAGISELAKSGHIANNITTGMYSGLGKEDSAIEVSTAIHEQFSSMDFLSLSGLNRIQAELQRRGLASDGITKSVAAEWEIFSRSQEQYLENCETSMASSIRGDFTTESSINIYLSAFDGATGLSTSDLIFLTGAKSDQKGRDDRSPNRRPVMNPMLTKKAQRLGITIKSREDLSQTKLVPLYRRTDRTKLIPEGFEQINDDLYARKENKFMVFNAAGLAGWRGIQPVTKRFSPADVLPSIITDG